MASKENKMTAKSDEIAKGIEKGFWKIVLSILKIVGIGLLLILVLWQLQIWLS